MRCLPPPWTGQLIVVGATPASILIDRVRSQRRPNHFGTGAGFVVDGAPVRQVWTPAGVIAESHKADNLVAALRPLSLLTDETCACAD